MVIGRTSVPPHLSEAIAVDDNKTKAVEAQLKLKDVCCSGVFILTGNLLSIPSYLRNVSSGKGGESSPRREVTVG